MSPREHGSRKSADSFQDTLRSETLAGTENLSSWIQHVAAQEGGESLFELEAWLRGLCSFLDLRHLPMGEQERADLVHRDFTTELEIVRQTVLRCEWLTSDVARAGQPDSIEVESIIKSQLRQGRGSDSPLGRVLEQPTPLDSLVRLLQGLNDLRVLLEALLQSPSPGYPVFLSLGRSYVRELRSYRYIDMLLTQRFKPEFDRVDNSAIAEILKKIDDDTLRRNVSLTLLHLYRFLRYLAIVQQCLRNDRPLRHTLVLFALLHEEMETLSDLLKTRFLKGKTDPGLKRAAELILYSLHSDMERVFERELVLVSRERDASPIFSRIENGHGLLQHGLHNSIVTLVQAFDSGFESRTLFPAMVEAQHGAQRLRQDLWSIRSYLLDVLEQRQEGNLDDIMARLSAFRSSSLKQLMHKDWEEFEKHCDVLVHAHSQIELRTHLRHLISFFETLVAEVSKRSVLRSSASPESPATEVRA